MADQGTEGEGMMRRYAERTVVTADHSIAEIRRVLSRYGADQFAYMEDPRRAAVAFNCNGRNIRFILPMPAQVETAQTPKGRARKSAVALQAHAQEVRRRWRALSLSIKAKLETVQSGIAEFETEFMPYMVLPNGKTVAENILPEIARAYATGRMPKLLEALE
jgi:hypothetical protein